MYCAVLTKDTSLHYKATIVHVKLNKNAKWIEGKQTNALHTQVSFTPPVKEITNHLRPNSKMNDANEHPKNMA